MRLEVVKLDDQSLSLRHLTEDINERMVRENDGRESVNRRWADETMQENI